MAKTFNPCATLILRVHFKKGDLMPEQDGDRLGTEDGARKLAIDMAFRVLIDNASASDPTLSDRLADTVDKYIAQLDPHSELEALFAAQAKANIAALVRPVSN